MNRRLDAVLDPCTQQSALPGIFGNGHSQLPWGGQRPHEVDDFQGRRGRQLIAKVAEFTLAGGYTQILAPTHVTERSTDPWIDVDADCTEQLRLRLDAEGGANIPVIYSLALPYASLRNPDQRRVFIETIRALPIEAIWLKVDGLGANSTANATCNYVAAALDFAELGIPVIGDHVGGLTGLALLAFGAAGGLAHGVTLKERFNARSWRREPTSTPFAPERRVYL
ncbi:MAG: hypothetical protein L0H63_11260, partial [Nitrococcus sp.]|nr:hypothetical protein [Nitrococcus sp.]